LAINRTLLPQLAKLLDDRAEHGALAFRRCAARGLPRWRLVCCTGLTWSRCRIVRIALGSFGLLFQQFAQSLNFFGAVAAFLLQSPFLIVESGA
jgi:hypothetical protein